MKLEAAVDQLDLARAAARDGIDRIELCSALSLGGLTPSYGLIESVRKAVSCPIHVLIRCRPGNFHYSEEEIQLMLVDIDQASASGCEGVVFGALDGDGMYHKEHNELLKAKADALGLNSIFHRAFDICTNKEEAIKTLVDVGFDGLLTTGGPATAQEGIQNLTRLQSEYGAQIEIIAGGGITVENARLICAAGSSYLHFSIHQKRKQKKTIVSFGDPKPYDENKIKEIARVQC